MDKQEIDNCHCDYNKLFGDNAYFIEKSILKKHEGICPRCYKKRKERNLKNG